MLTTPRTSWINHQWMRYSWMFHDIHVRRYSVYCLSRHFIHFFLFKRQNISWTFFASVDSANQVNKLPLVGINYLKDIRRISTFRAKALRRDNSRRRPSLETSKFSLYFSGSCIPTNESLSKCFATLPYIYFVHVFYDWSDISPNNIEQSVPITV
jgi:hypothetical protein